MYYMYVEFLLLHKDYVQFKLIIIKNCGHMYMCDYNEDKME